MISIPQFERPTVCIVVIGWREAPLLLDSLASVVASVDTVPYEVRIVLNEPTASLVRAVNENVRGAAVHRFRANLGFGGAANFAVATSDAPYVALLNDDCIVEMQWLEELLDIHQRRERCAIAGSRFLNPDGSLQEAGSVLWADGSTWAVGDGNNCVDANFERQADYCSAGSVLIKRVAWDEVGGFDDRYYPAYYEDVDLSLRIKQRGWEIWYQPRSVVRHARSSSTEPGFRSAISSLARDIFLDIWRDVLISRRMAPEVELALWDAMDRPTRVLVLDDTIPDRSAGSGYGRMYDALKVLSGDPELHVAFHPRLGASDDFVDGLPRVRVVKDLVSHLKTAGVEYDAVVVSRPHNAQIFAETIASYLPHAPVIYDAEAMYSRRLDAESELCALEREAAALRAQAADMRVVEAAILARSDAVVSISDGEAELARRHATCPVYVVEPWLDGTRITTNPFSSRAHIGLIAGWAAGPGSPNCDGLLWFAHEVLPRVRARIPWCRLLVTGNDPPSDVTWLAGPAVEFVGLVPEIADFYDRIRVVVSPTRFGAGVKLKTVEAVQHGLPVVATREASVGLTAELRRAVWTTDDPDEFAGALIALVSDEAAWKYQRKLATDAARGAALASRGVGMWTDIVRAALGQHDRERQLQ